VLVCIERSSRTLAAIERSGIFCIKTSSAYLVELAEIFAGRHGIEGEARFAMARWRSLTTGAPALLDSLVAFDRRPVATHDIASHRVLIGEAVAIGGRGEGRSLLYHHRRFETLAGRSSDRIFRPKPT
jgi:flavin reductase